MRRSLAQTALGTALFALLPVLAACTGPSAERLDAGGPPPTDPGLVVEVPATPAAGPFPGDRVPEVERAAAAGLLAWKRRNPDSPGLVGEGCVGFVSPAAGPAEVRPQWRSLLPFGDALFPVVAQGQDLWRSAATCDGGPGITASSGGAGGPARVILCQGITKVADGWRMHCGWRGPGPMGEMPEYLVSAVEGRPDAFRVARTCPACVLTQFP